MTRATKLAYAIGLAGIVISGNAGTAAAQPGSRYQTIGERESMGLSPFGRPHYGWHRHAWYGHRWRTYAFAPYRSWGHHHRIVRHSR